MAESISLCAVFGRENGRSFGSHVRMKCAEAAHTDHVTIVSAVYDIGREAADGRKMSDYKEWFLKTLKQVRHPIFLFLDPSLGWKREITDARMGGPEIFISQVPFREVPLFRNISKIKEITGNMWFQQHANKGDLTYRLPVYAPLVWSKFLWEAIALNCWNSRFFIWLDAGGSRFFDETIQFSWKDFNPGFTVCGTLQKHYGTDIIGSSVGNIAAGVLIGDANGHRVVREEMMRVWLHDMLDNNRYDNEQVGLAIALSRNKSSKLYYLAKEESTFRSVLG